MPKITCPSCSTSYDLPDGSISAEGRKVKCATCGTKWMAKPETKPVVDPVLDSVATGVEDSGKGASWEGTRLTKNEPVAAVATAVSSVMAGDDVSEKSANDKSVGKDVALQVSAAKSAAPRKRRRPVNPLLRSEAARNKSTKVNKYEVVEQKRKRREQFLRPMMFLGSFLLIAAVIYIREPIVRVAPDLASLFETIGFKVNLKGFEIQNVRSERVFENTGPVLIITGQIQNIRDTVAQTPKIRFALKTNTQEEIYGWEHELALPTIVPGGVANFQSRLPAPPPLGRNVSVYVIDG